MVMPWNATRYWYIAPDRASGFGHDIALDQDALLVRHMLQLNLRLAYRVYLSNHESEVAQRRPSGATQENVRQRLLLLWSTPVIHVEDNAPRNARFIDAKTPGQHDRETREINGTRVAL